MPYVVEIDGHFIGLYVVEDASGAVGLHATSERPADNASCDFTLNARCGDQAIRIVTRREWLPVLADYWNRAELGSSSEDELDHYISAALLQTLQTLTADNLLEFAALIGAGIAWQAVDPDENTPPFEANCVGINFTIEPRGTGYLFSLELDRAETLQ